MAEAEAETEVKSRHIVAVAVDKSEHAEWAFNYYLSHVYQPDHYVVLLHVPDMTDALYTSGGLQASPLSSDMWYDIYTQHQADADVLKELYLRKLKDHKVDGKWVVLPVEGKPGATLVNGIEENKAEMMVMGCRGLGAIRRTIMGSVSDYVLHHADIPVMIYKQKYD